MNKFETFISILKAELVVALGCTEPIAIALCAAKAREILEEKPEIIDVYCSGNIIKNVHGVTIPNSNGLKGIEIAAALGALGGDASRKLEVLSSIKKSTIVEADHFVEEGRVRAHNEKNVDKLFIHCVVRSGAKTAEAVIEGSHTNFTTIKKNGVLVEFDRHELPENVEVDAAADALSIDDIYEFATEVEFKNHPQLVEILDREIEFNMNIAQGGLEADWGNQIGKTLANTSGNDLAKEAAAWAAAGTDARMGGCALPVVLNSGSGNQGLTASVPVIFMAKKLGLSKEKLYRALVISNLVSIHEKKHIGYLSAFCGAVNAATGAGAGIAYLNEFSISQIKMVITNTLAACFGILCDGAKPSCSLKIFSSLSSAFLAIEMAKQDNFIASGDGIIGSTIEQTIDNIGQIAVNGMNIADEEILKVIMDHK